MNQPSEDLKTFTCPCGYVAVEVINAESNYRRGWLCTACGDFFQALGRERVLEKEVGAQ